MNRISILTTLSIAAASCMNAPPEYGMMPSKSKEHALEDNPMLYAKHIEEPKSLDYTPNVLLTGRAGAGKTSLLNKLCGTRKAVGKGKSVTRELAYIPVNCGNYALKIVDTPGTDSDEERYKHASLLYHALTTKPYNSILTVVRFDDRYYRMVEDYQKLIEPYRKYEKSALILVSRFGENPEEDEDFNPRQYRDDIIKEFESNDIHNNIIFYSKRSECNRDDLADMIYGSVSRMSPVNIELSKEDFDFAYGAYISGGQLTKVRKECDRAMAQIEKEFLDLMRAYKNDDDADNILQYLSLEIEDRLTEKAHECYEKTAPNLDDLEADNFGIYLHAQKIKHKDSFLEKMKGQMKWNMMGEDDVRKMIRRCPICQEVWIHAGGCMGYTICGNLTGNLPSEQDTLKSSWWFCFDLVREGGKFLLKKLKEPKAKTVKKALVYDDQDERVEKKQVTGKAKVQRKGCGAKLHFSTAPMMTEEELLELFKVDSLETLKAYVKSGSKRHKTLASKYEANIDKTFHS